MIGNTNIVLYIAPPHHTYPTLYSLLHISTTAQATLHNYRQHHTTTTLPTPHNHTTPPFLILPYLFIFAYFCGYTKKEEKKVKWECLTFPVMKYSTQRYVCEASTRKIEIIFFLYKIKFIYTYSIITYIDVTIRIETYELSNKIPFV